MVNEKAGGRICRMALVWIVPVVVLMLSACAEHDADDGPGIEPLVAAIKTTVPLAYAASVAMGAVTGPGEFPAEVSNQCSAFPCAALARVSLVATELPVVLEQDAEVLVAGLWSAADSAVMTFSISGISLGSENNPVLKIATIPIVAHSDGLVLAYSSADINIDSEPEDSVSLSDSEMVAELARVGVTLNEDPEINVNLDVFVVTVANGGTGTNFADDTYTVSGGGQYIGVDSRATRVLQLGMANVRMTPACVINPDQGLAVVNELEVGSGAVSQWPKLGVGLFEFHAACDGKVRVLAAAGSYGVLADQNIDLGF